LLNSTGTVQLTLFQVIESDEEEVPLQAGKEVQESNDENQQPPKSNSRIEDKFSNDVAVHITVHTYIYMHVHF
jgi:hypothetical protein